MSFSRDVKEELSKINNLANKQEVKYEFLGYLMSNNIIENSKMIKYSTENDYNIDRFAKIIRNIGIEEFDIQVNGQVFFIQIKKKHLEEIKDLENVFGEKSKTNNTSRTNNTNSTNNINSTIIFNSELDNDLFKSFMRGLFMGSGSINNPENKYHLECGVRDKEILQQIIDIMKDNSIFVKQMENIFYIKDGEEISKFLAFIGASKSVLKFEEIRVKRHMNNKVNRIVNCQSANLLKKWRQSGS